MLKISAFYLEKQKRFITNKYNLGRSLSIGHESSRRWHLLSKFSLKVLGFEVNKKHPSSNLQEIFYHSGRLANNYPA